MESPRKYVYSALPPRAIRVLELEPASSPDSPLTCRVVVQDIEGAPYEAVSYVWGDPTPADSVVCVDGTDGTHNGETGIGANLAKALYAFRPAAGSRSRRLWVDALCINQADLDERQSQVRLMGHVYGQAQCVLCWLDVFAPPARGEATARLALDFIRQFNANPHEQLGRAHQHLHFGEVAEDDEGGAILEAWLAVKAMFDIEYFHRAWIIQEVGLARIARLYWGNEETWIEWTEVAFFCKFMDDYGASLVTHLDLKSWVCNHINLVWAMKSDGHPVYNFVEVLHWARVHKSTDARDYVYALLSHPSATVDGTLLIQPNYTKSMVQTYVGLAVNVINRTQSLDILAFVDHDGDPYGELPSWVPDWHALNLVAPLRSPTQAASPMVDDSVEISPSGHKAVLKCQAIVVDSIAAMSDMIDQTQLTVTTLAKEEQKKVPFLIDHIWTRTVADPKIPLASLRQFLDSLAFVMSGGHRHNLPSATGEAQNQQQAELAAFILSFEHIRPPGTPSKFLATLQPEEMAMLKEIGARGSAAQFTQDITWTSMCRKLFRTTRGHIGLGPRIMRDGDVCAVLQGVVYPLVFRRRDDRFLLVGPALLYGFMDGEADRLCRAGDLSRRKIQIV